MRIWPIMIALLVAAAGCTDDAADSTSDDMQTQLPVDLGNETMEPQVFTATETITGGAGSPAVSFQSGAAALTFSVRSNATLMFAELTWDDPAADLDLHMGSPGTMDTEWDYANNNGAPGAPDSPHSITVERPASGEWKATAFPNGPAAGVEFTIAVTVFFEESAVPEGYTAL